jgi:hypothetical protein
MKLFSAQDIPAVDGPMYGYCGRGGPGVVSQDEQGNRYYHRAAEIDRRSASSAAVIHSLR